jgi:peptidoglycan/LPS O-acetylase OafA/YrhL
MLIESKAQAPARAPVAGHMPQLDGLRAIAVALVVMHHYAPKGWRFGADRGVHLFFVLSGFLITGILLRTRESALKEGRGRVRALGKFYARRFLRIFPLYYFVIAVAFVFNVDPAREIIGWLLTYTLNFRMASQGWFEATFAHFWSLAVEEQFYLVWPWLILFAPRSWLKPMAAAGVVATIVYRLIYVWSGYPYQMRLATYISTLSNLDNLGIGALLAMYGVYNAASYKRFKTVVVPCAMASILLLYRSPNEISIPLGGTLEAVVLCFLVWGGALGFSGLPGRVLEWKPLLYVGKISYGIYVYHPLMLLFCNWLLQGTAWEGLPWPVISLASVFLTMAVSSLSWYLLEKPCNELKRYF